MKTKQFIAFLLVAHIHISEIVSLSNKDLCLTTSGEPICGHAFSHECNTHANMCSVSKQACDNFNSLTFMIRSSVQQMRSSNAEMVKYKMFVNNIVACPVLKHSVCLNKAKCFDEKKKSRLIFKVDGFKIKTCPCSGRYLYECNKSTICAANKHHCDLYMKHKKKNDKSLNKLKTC